MNVTAQILLVWLIAVLILLVDDDHEQTKRHVQANQCPSSCLTSKCTNTGDTP